MGPTSAVCYLLFVLYILFKYPDIQNTLYMAENGKNDIYMSYNMKTSQNVALRRRQIIVDYLKIMAIFGDILLLDACAKGVFLALDQ